MNTDDAFSIQEDALLSEESDVLSGGTSNTSYAILTVLKSWIRSWPKWAKRSGQKTAPKLSEKLAKIVNLRWLNKLDETNLKEKSNKYLRPINCDRLITPKVNPEIWGRLDRQTRGKDVRLSNLQTTLTKVGNITAKNNRYVVKGSCRGRESWCWQHDPNEYRYISIALLGHISFEISQRRRDAIRPTLHKDYSTLCASHVPITNFLFGDELQTQLNHIRASNKISSTASPSNSAFKRSYGKSYAPGNNQP